MNLEHKRLIERLEASAEDLVAYAGKLSADDLAVRPAPTEWTLHQVLAHVRDAEQQVFLYRLKRILREDHPAVENFDQDAWTREHYSVDEPVKKILSEYRAARRKIIRLLRRARDKDWARTAQHPTWGVISVDWLTTHTFNHTLEHAAQLGDAHEKKLLKKLNG